MEIVKQILPFLLPPLLGAVIGFITNAIAISMLFRPYTEKRIFKIRLPFTPGILPRQRYAFAESVGNMVQQQLLTEDALRRQTESEAFRKSIRNYISKFTDDLFQLQPKTIISFVDSQKTDSGLNSILNNFINLVKKSDIASEFIDTLLSAGMNYLGEKKINELTSLAREISQNQMPAVVGKDSIKQAALFYVDTIVQNILKDNPSVQEILTKERKEKILTTLEIVYPYLLQSLVLWLRQEKTFSELTYRGRIIVKNIINKLSALQKFIVTAGQYDKTIADKMEEIITDIIHQIETGGNSKTNREHIFSGISSEIDALEHKTLADLFRNKTIAVQKLVHNFAELLIDSVFRQADSKGAYNPGLPDGSQSIRQLLTTFSGLDWDALIEHIGQGLKSAMQNKSFSAAGEIFDIVKSVLESRKEKSLADLLGLDDAFKNTVDDFLCKQAILLINSKVPEILDSINVKELVVDKINSLDIKNVEKILLSVIQKHLKWINIFGAFLGAIIGMIQILSDKLM